MTDLNTLSKAELNALLIEPLNASALKKMAKADLVAMVENARAEQDEAERLATFERRRAEYRAAHPAPKKVAAPKRRGITVQPKGEKKPVKEGTVQARVIEALRVGATIGDLRRICIKRDGGVWADSAILGLFTNDVAGKGYGVRTEFRNGYQLFLDCSLDDETSFSRAVQLTHPDDLDADQKAALLAEAVANGYDETATYPVYFLVE